MLAEREHAAIKKIIQAAIDRVCDLCALKLFFPVTIFYSTSAVLIKYFTIGTIRGQAFFLKIGTGMNVTPLFSRGFAPINADFVLEKFA
jgi:hypothetical protein